MSTNPKRQPKGTKGGGQFAPDVNPESTVDLGDPAADDTRPAWSVQLMAIDGHDYSAIRDVQNNGVVHYTLTDPREGGGWRIDYDTLTRQAKVHGISPRRSTPSWRDIGEADIRHVMKELEPKSTLIKLDGKTYLVDGPTWPLSKSHLSGISTGEMMLIGGKSEDDLRDYVAQQRNDTDRSESERPDMAASFAETRRYLDGIELAATFGADTAKAGTVGAMNERFAEDRNPDGSDSVANTGEKMVKCADCQTEIHPLDVFPKGRCVECHAAVTPMPTAQDVRRAWGIR